MGIESVIEVTPCPADQMVFQALASAFAASSSDPKSIFLEFFHISSVMPTDSRLGRQKLAWTPETAAVYTISSALLLIIISLYSVSAWLSSTLIKRVPI